MYDTVEAALAELIQSVKLDEMNPLHPKNQVNGVNNDMCDQDGATVFLGGACNPTTWRKDIAIPILEQEGISYFNPQVDEWSPELVDKENRAKDNAEVLLFVLDTRTRGIASMIETAEYITYKRRVYLVIEEMGESDHIEALKAHVDLQSCKQSSAFVELTAVTERIGRKTVHDGDMETTVGGEAERTGGDTIMKRMASLPRNLPELPESYVVRQDALAEIKLQLFVVSVERAE